VVPLDLGRPHEICGANTILETCVVVMVPLSVFMANAIFAVPWWYMAFFHNRPLK